MILVFILHGMSSPIFLRFEEIQKFSVNSTCVDSDYVNDEMHRLDPDGFTKRAPTSKKKHRVALVVLGPDFEWSCDGHEKLSKLGFPIWGIRDVWSGKWLGLWVVPNNRLKVVVAYLYLSLVRELGGKCVSFCFVIVTNVSIRYAYSNHNRSWVRNELHLRFCKCAEVCSIVVAHP